jgi:hypothetical protein
MIQKVKKSFEVTVEPKVPLTDSYPPVSTFCTLYTGKVYKALCGSMAYH